MRFGILVVSSCAVLVATDSRVAAQRVAVVPPSAAKLDGNRWLGTPFREPGSRRLQVLIASRHLVGLAERRIHEVAFRKDLQLLQSYGDLRGDERVRVRLSASWSDADPATPSPSFAQNVGTAVELFDGVVVLPRVPVHDARLVASWQPREAPTIRFTRPLAHEPGKTLVLDFASDGGRTGRSWTWPVDAVERRADAQTRNIGDACWKSPSAPVVTVARGTLRPGMQIAVEAVTPPNPVGSFLLFGSSDRTAFGSIRLPMPIVGTGCQLLVSPDAVVPSLFFRGVDVTDEGISKTEIATPYLRSLHGGTVFFQYLLLHRSGRVLALKTTHAVAARFATSMASLGVSCVAARDRDATRGRVYLDFAPVLRLRSD